MNPFELAQAVTEADRSLDDVSPVYAELAEIAATTRILREAEMPEDLIVSGEQIAEMERLQTQREQYLQDLRVLMAVEKSSARPGRLMSSWREIVSAMPDDELDAEALRDVSNSSAQFTKDIFIQYLVRALIQRDDTEGALSLVRSLPPAPNVSGSCAIIHHADPTLGMEQYVRTIIERGEGTDNDLDFARGDLVEILASDNKVTEAKEVAEGIAHPDCLQTAYWSIAQYAQDKHSLDKAFAKVDSMMGPEDVHPAMVYGSIAAKCDDFEKVQAIVAKLQALTDQTHALSGIYSECPSQQIKDYYQASLDNLYLVDIPHEDRNAAHAIACEVMAHEGDLSAARVRLEGIGDDYPVSKIRALAAIAQYDDDPALLENMEQLYVSVRTPSESLACLERIVMARPEKGTIDFAMAHLPSDFSQNPHEASKLAIALVQAGDIPAAEILMARIPDDVSKATVYAHLVKVTQDKINARWADMEAKA